MTVLKSDRADECPPSNTCADGEQRFVAGIVAQSPRKGDAISGLPAEIADDVHVFHAGTSEKDGKVVTNGGRVLCVTALGDKVQIAAERAYELVDRIKFDGAQFRRDIGHRAFGRR